MSEARELTMLPWERLRDKIISLEGKPYAAYQALEGAYRFERFVLYVDRVVPDPPGIPASMRVRVDQAEARFPKDLWSSRMRRVALEDYVARRWLDGIRKIARTRGGRGAFTVDIGGQAILERTACRVAEDFVEVRGGMVLPAEGRKVAAKSAQTLFFEDLPQIVDGALIHPNQNPAPIQRQVEVAEDAEASRTQLAAHGLVAFLADGSVLPREGTSDRPQLSRLVPLQAPEELRVTLTLPHRGPVTGLGIPRGVTVIMGSPFSGRSTLLGAIAACVNMHIPGDGREYCGTMPDAVMVRTDESRRIEGVNFAPFISALPGGEDPTRYRTEHAPEIVSQGAAIVEALETGCSLLLIDEDTSAAGFLSRDALWQRLNPHAQIPLTPLADLLRPLYEEHGVSTIIVTSLGHEYVPVADTVLAMDGFRPRVVTAVAKQAAAEVGWHRLEGKGRFGGIHHRIPLPESLNALRGRKLRGETPHQRGGPPETPSRAVMLGREFIDLTQVEQLVDPAQARAIAAALVFAADRGYADGVRTIREILGLLEMEIAQHGLEVLSQEGPPGDFALPRRHEIAAALNRLRTLRVKG